MISKLRKFLLKLLAGNNVVIINATISDYDWEMNFIRNKQSNYFSFNNRIFDMRKVVVEEMYTGSKNKKVTRCGNSFVLSIV